MMLKQKQLFAVENAEVREKALTAFKELDPKLHSAVVVGMKSMADYYAMNASELLFTVFDSDYLTDTDGVFHAEVAFEIQAIELIDSAVWLFGDEYCINVSAFGATRGALLDSVLALMD